MDDGREKHDVCPKCRKRKLLTTYWCGINCPGNPGARGVSQGGEEAADEEGGRRGAAAADSRGRGEAGPARRAQSGDEHEKLMAEGAQYASKVDWRRAARSLREAIALKPHQPTAYFNLGHVLSNSGRDVEAAQQYLEARVRSSVGLEGWATATAAAFHVLKLEVCSEAAEPEWWNDEGLKALSARVVRVVPNEVLTARLHAGCGAARSC